MGWARGRVPGRGPGRGRGRGRGPGRKKPKLERASFLEKARMAQLTPNKGGLWALPAN